MRSSSSARGARTEPNMRATHAVELYDGLVAASQNCWPSLRFDVGAINNALSRLHPRRASTTRPSCGRRPRVVAALRARRSAVPPARAARRRAPDPDRYEHQYAHCDVLVVGAGPAGLAAAPRRGARRRARHPSATRVRVAGGSLRRRRRDDRRRDGRRLGRGGRPRSRGASRRDAAAAHHRVRPLRRQSGRPGRARRRSSRGAARAPAARSGCGRSARGAVVLATGAHERAASPSPTTTCPARCWPAPRAPTSTATRCAPARAPWSFTNNDGAYATALALHAPASRSRRSSTRARTARRRGAAARRRCSRPADRRRRRGRRRARQAARRAASMSCRSRRGRGSRAHRLRSRLRLGRLESRPCTSSRRRAAKLRYDEALATFVPDDSSAPDRFPRAGPTAASTSAQRSPTATPQGLRRPRAPDAARAHRPRRRGRHRLPPARCCRLWSIPRRHERRQALRRSAGRRHRRRRRAGRARGLPSVEHLKRYTTLGMGTDQGKTSNVIGLALLAEATAAVASGGRHDDVPPAVHAGHAGRFRRPGDGRARRADAPFGDARLARRARRALASTRACGSGRTRIRGRANRRTTRRTARRRTSARNVGLVDVSTLGKIELAGPPTSPNSSNRVYINRWDTLAVGRCRYGVMLRDDGMVIDDGTTSRLAAVALPDDDDDRQRGQGDAAPRAPAAGRLAGSRRARDVGDRAMGGRRAVGAERARACSRSSSTSTFRTTPFRSWRSASASCAARRARCPRACSG